MRDKQDYRTLIQKLIADEKVWSCGEASSRNYVQASDWRFSQIIDICKRLAPIPSACVLDVGRSAMSERLSHFYSNLYTIGFPLETDKGGHREVNPLPNVPHIVYDLLSSNDPDTWPDYPEKFALVVLGEVLEHIWTAPEFTILMLSYLLQPGGFLLVTTPNAGSFLKRKAMFMGRNPFERLRYFPQNPGHFREYTLAELTGMGRTCRLDVREAFPVAFRKSSKFRTAFRLINAVPSLRDGLVVVYQKP